MKQHWQRVELKINALSLRERVMAFAVAVLVLITLMDTLLLNPLLEKQKQLSQQVKQGQQKIIAMQAEIQRRVKSHELDPNAPNLERLRSLRQQSTKMRDDLLGMHKGLVSPDKMAFLLEDLLKRNGKLHLTSLKTLPVTTVSQSAVSEPHAVNEKNEGAGTIAQTTKTENKLFEDTVYKHGVEIVVQGGYPEIMDYLAQLEAMPWQLFWSKAKLNVDAYPKASLTLTLFTLSLDKKWLHI